MDVYTPFLLDQRMSMRLQVEGHVVHEAPPPIEAPDFTTPPSSTRASMMEGEGADEAFNEEATDPETAAYERYQEVDIEAMTEEELEQLRARLLEEPTLISSQRLQQISTQVLQRRRELADASARREGLIVSDSDANCVECRKPFSLLNWAYICNNCGSRVCADCSPARIFLPSRSTSRSRVCKTCALRIEKDTRGKPIHFVTTASPTQQSFYLRELPWCLWQLRNITTLRICDFGLRDISPHLGLLRLLVHLDLSHNRLLTLPAELDKLDRLEWLTLAHNSMRQLPDVLRRLPSLRHLDVSSNKLGARTDHLKALPQLTWLNISKNKDLDPGTLAYLTPLQPLGELNVAHIRLNRVPAQIWRLRTLTRLDLSACNLSKLSHHIAHLQLLEYLNLSRNQLQELSGAIGSLDNLLTLIVNYNPLAQLPLTLFRLRQLETLELRQCHLAHIPEAVGWLQNLKHLDVSENRLDGLPTTLTRLPNLERLEVHGNLWKSELPQNPTRNLPRLLLEVNGELKAVLASCSIPVQLWSADGISVRSLPWLYDAMTLRLEGFNSLFNINQDILHESNLPEVPNDEADVFEPTIVRGPPQHSSGTASRSSSTTPATDILQHYQMPFETCLLDPQACYSILEPYQRNADQHARMHFTAGVHALNTVGDDIIMHALVIAELPPGASIRPFKAPLSQIREVVAAVPLGRRRFLNAIEPYEVTENDTGHTEQIRAHTGRIDYWRAVTDSVDGDIVITRRNLKPLLSAVANFALHVAKHKTQPVPADVAQAHPPSALHAPLARLAQPNTEAARNDAPSPSARPPAGTVLSDSRKTQVLSALAKFPHGVAPFKPLEDLLREAWLDRTIRPRADTNMSLLRHHSAEYSAHQSTSGASDDSSAYDDCAAYVESVLERHSFARLIQAKDRFLLAQNWVLPALCSIFTRDHLAWLGTSEFQAKAKQMRSSLSFRESDLRALRSSGMASERLVRSLLQSMALIHAESPLAESNNRRLMTFLAERHSHVENLIGDESKLDNCIHVLVSAGILYAAPDAAHTYMVTTFLPEAPPSGAEKALGAISIPTRRESYPSAHINTQTRLYHVDCCPAWLFARLQCLAAERGYTVYGWQTGAVFMHRHGDQSTLCIASGCEAEGGGFEVRLTAIVLNEDFPLFYNMMTSALLPLVACLEHLLTVQCPGVLWESSIVCASCAQEDVVQLQCGRLRGLDILVTSLPATPFIHCPNCNQQIIIAASLLNLLSDSEQEEQLLRDRIGDLNKRMKNLGSARTQPINTFITKLEDQDWDLLCLQNAPIQISSPANTRAPARSEGMGQIFR
ncbi:uncharacterized protein MONBRDRAFT_33530 [Monosiga brevicollis MX1]|uniref:FYVE-type domain-containing protein n=1 Tax=Monosiga brevicollis TaxID=81824 RepID=A9V5X2_MONBE|nr:uncharacterized protein MONBRDRAFT_33530 [Monosiga brevicollis MX1]EDQ87185.1 predicted protein [Monosiga brevicollis MX1]|eukprot:XP_001748128.1 hypothetical protein [Monosiga brevicollis MX1]